MDLSDIRDRKKALEEIIFEYIECFERETDTSIEYVRLEKMDLMGDRRHSVAGVKIELAL